MGISGCINPCNMHNQEQATEHERPEEIACSGQKVRSNLLRCKFARLWNLNFWRIVIVCSFIGRCHNELAFGSFIALYKSHLCRTGGKVIRIYVLLLTDRGLEFRAVNGLLEVI
jgi:hypothetical protein